MTLEKLRALADGFFEWDTEDRSTVTTTSALLFARYALWAADKESASALREAAKEAIADICAARLCEVNSMSSRQEMLRLMIRATDTLRRALEQPEQPKQDKHITDGSLCWCGPELVYVDPENGAKVWVHKEPR